MQKNKGICCSDKVACHAKIVGEGMAVWKFISNFARILKNVNGRGNNCARVTFLVCTVKAKKMKQDNGTTFQPTANGEYRDAMNGLERFVKRLTDILVSGLGMIALSPAFLLIWLLILVSGGKPIYKQERIGYKGKPFNIMKFRTMVKDCEKDGIPRTEEERSAQMTRVGRFLRDHHLDEFPQLWNVFRGDMSLVGYRPERQVFIDKILAENPDYVQLYKIRPGLTSKATLYNGYTDTMEKMLTRLDMDLEYMTTRSLKGDIAIIWKTVSSILVGKKF